MILFYFLLWKISTFKIVKWTSMDLSHSFNSHQPHLIHPQIILKISNIIFFTYKHFNCISNTTWLKDKNINTTLWVYLKKWTIPYRCPISSESESLSVVSDSLQPHVLHSSWNSPGQNPRVGSLSLLQGIFPTQGWNPGLPHCTQILYQLNHQGSPRILECVAYPFSSRSSQPRNRTRVSCIAGRFFTNEALKFLTNLICFSNKFFKSGSWWSPQNTANCLTHLFDHFNL